MRNILKKIIFLIFFEFFTKTVLKTLLRGRETVRKNYGIVFEKFPKIMFFLTSACPSIHHPPSTTIHHHPPPSIRQYKLARRLVPRRRPIRTADRKIIFNNSMRARQMSSDSCFSRPVSTQSASHTLFLQDNFYSHNYYKYRKI